MTNYMRLIFCSALSLLLLSACESHESRRYTDHHTHDSVRHRNNVGVVADIEIINVENRTSGGGAVLGAIVGGVLGHQMGGGRGRDVTTGIGVVGGAVAGNTIERRNTSESEIYRITVRFERGRRQTFDYRDLNDLRVGDHVKVENGQLYQM